MSMSSIKQHIDTTLKAGLGIVIVAGLFSCGGGQQSVKSSSAPGQQDALTGSAQVSQSDREKYRAGITALYQGELSSARRTFNEFIRLHPQLAGAYSNLALIEYKEAKYAEAMKLAEKAITLNPQQAQAYHIRGKTYVKLGKIHEAKADYLKAVELKPGYIQAQYNLALLYDIYLQDIASAVKHYELYMALNKTQDEKTRDWISHLKGTLANG